MAKNLIVKLSMKSGKVHEIDIPNPDGKTLEDLVNELNGSRATFVGINDGLLSIRWSEVESLEDVSHLESIKVNGNIKFGTVAAKAVHSEEDIKKIGEYFAKEFEKRK